METLSNSILTVQIAEHGAELQSIKKDGKEYLWQGDAKFWGRRSPVLFPIVGRVWNNKYPTSRRKGKGNLPNVSGVLSNQYTAPLSSL